MGPKPFRHLGISFMRKCSTKSEASFPATAQVELVPTLDAAILMPMPVCKPLLFALVLFHAGSRTISLPPIWHGCLALHAFCI